MIGERPFPNADQPFDWKIVIDAFGSGVPVRRLREQPLAGTRRGGRWPPFTRLPLNGRFCR
jgi:hypothetical protein